MRFFITGVGFEPVWMRRRRLALQSTVPLPTAIPYSSVAQSVEAPYFAMLGDVAASVRVRIPRQYLQYTQIILHMWVF